MKGHGLMFHHFHSCEEDRQLGSIDSEEFKMMIEFYIKSGYVLNNPCEFIGKVHNNELSEKDVVFTFDDNLLCQYRIAKPILDQYGIKAFWFINTQTLEKGELDRLEVFRHFRNTCYSKIDDFYDSFFKSVELLIRKSKDDLLKNINMDNYLVECPFYSYNDKCFKYLRDEILTEDEYVDLMYTQMEMKNYQPEKMKDLLWMKEENLKELCKEGHAIGLHSHTHYTCISKLSYEEQFEEYSKNKQILENILSEPVVSMSHPCGEYSVDTFEVLEKIKIQIGFVDNLFVDSYNKFLIPREDHANIKKKLKI